MPLTGDHPFMTSRSFENAESLVAPLYFIAALLIATPLMDFATSVVPLRPGSLEWRFASVGLLSGFLLTPLLGLVIALAVAAYADDVRGRRFPEDVHTYTMPAGELEAFEAETADRSA